MLKFQARKSLIQMLSTWITTRRLMARHSNAETNMIERIPGLAIFIVPLLLAKAIYAQTLPAAAGVINVKDYGAIGDGKADDTDALRKAVVFALDRQGRYATPPFVYFPAGTYRITGPLLGKVSEHGWSGGWRSGLILWGEDRQKSIIKLSDNLPAYADPKNPECVIATGSESDKRTQPGDKPLSGGGNRAFRHGIYHLTVDIGKSNPGAVGIDFVVSNRGAIEDVTIRSSDDNHAGSVGLKLTRNWPGPGLVKNVAIEGFDYAMLTNHAQYSMTFEDITIRDQRIAGLSDKYGQALFFRKLHSKNKVPVFILPNNRALLVLLDSKLEGGTDSGAAIEGAAAIKYLQNVDITGYRQSIKDAPDARPVGEKINHYAHPSQAQPDGSEIAPLPVVETPMFWSDDPNDLVNVVDFGATPSAPGDDADAIQSAIDSGKPIVYLPNGSYQVSRTIILRGKTRLLIGMQSSIGITKDAPVEPLLRVDDGDGAVNVEHLWISGVAEQNSSRPFALRHVDLKDGYRNTESGKGDVFFEDTIGKPILVKHPQRFFGRQVNCEFGDDPLIENHGGAMWLFGYKTEGQMTVLKNVGGRVDVVGGLFYPLRDVPKTAPLFVNDGGTMRLTYVMNGKNYPTHLSWRKLAADSWQAVTSKDVIGRGPSLLQNNAE